VSTIAEFVARAGERLRAGGVPAAQAPGDAEVLARHVLKWDLTRYAISRRDAPPAEFQARFDTLIERRLAREPVSQIVGHREFWGLDFDVTRDVLTPRPETELIVEQALRLFRESPPEQIIDVGTGSGCLAVSLATEFPAARVIATDISDAALAVARRNAARHRVDSRIDFRCTDLLDGVEARAALIVSNPPYVASKVAPALMPEVREYEPHVALFAGDDGLEVYRRLFASAPGCLRPGGRLIVEVGYDQDGAVADLARPHGLRLETTASDLQDIVRTVVFIHEP